MLSTQRYVAQSKISHRYMHLDPSANPSKTEGEKEKQPPSPIQPMNKKRIEK